MDSTPEFPHVALSPGEMSPEVESTGQDQPTPEDGQSKTKEATEETTTSAPGQGPPAEENPVETVKEPHDQEALQLAQAVTGESNDTKGKTSEDAEDMANPNLENLQDSEQMTEEQTALGNQQESEQAGLGKSDESLVISAPSEQAEENVCSSENQAEAVASECDQGEIKLQKLDTIGIDQQPIEDVQVTSTGSPEASDEATKDSTITASDGRPKDNDESRALEVPAEVQTPETDKHKKDVESVTSKEELNIQGQEESRDIESSEVLSSFERSTSNVVADLISKGLISEFSQEKRTEDPGQDKPDSSERKDDDTADAEVIKDATPEDSAGNGSPSVEEEQQPEPMDTQVLESEDGNTQDSMADLSTKDSRDDSNVDKVPKIYDECSMESFVSAKSSEFEYRDSLQGSPLPVKRVRELIDESPRPSPKRSRTSTPTVQSDDDLGHFPAENVFEYQWPQDNPGEWYFVQEQISEFLGVKSFKRKYPALERRVMDGKEKDFLRERGVVTEEQVTLGLTALKGDEVYDLMMKDYPNRYTEYARVIQEKQRQNISNQQKGYEAAPKMDSNKIKEYIKKATKKAAEFNALLMREKREERQYYFDLQTMQLHMPQSKMKKLSKEDTEIGAYPVAVIPGQYQDYCRHYSSTELNYLPLNTALYGPMAIRRKTDYAPQVDEEEEGDDDLDIMEELSKNEGGENNKSKPTNQPQPDLQQQQRQQQEQRLQQLLSQPVQQQQKPTPQRQQTPRQQQPPQEQQQRQQQQPPAPTTPVTSRSPSSAPTILRPRAGPIIVQPGPESGGSGDSDTMRLPGPEALQQSMEAVVPTPTRPYQPKIKPTAICGLCLKDRRSNTKGVPENLVHCSQCDNSGHPSCLDMNDELVATIKTYPWQCMECKTCSQCGDPTHEDKMMFCDKCDRGYHTFCVGLTDIPTGNWLCPTCATGGLPPPVPPPPPSNLSLGPLPMLLQQGALQQQVLQGPPLQHLPSLPPHLQQGVPPQQQGVPPHQQGVPPQQQGVQPQQQGVPPQQQGVPPHQQGVPPQQQGVPPQQQGVQPQQQVVPPQQQGVPPVQQGLPPQQQGVSPQQQGVTPQQQGALPQQQTVAPPQQGVPSQQQGVPPQQQGVPPPQQQLPPQQQGIPAMPPQQQGMPPQPHGLPPHPGLPLQQQGLPPKQQVLPPQQQVLPPQMQGMPPVPPQGLPVTPEQSPLASKRKNSKR